MDPGQTTIHFAFEDPIVEMMSIAMFSDTCKSPENMVCSYEYDDGILSDICNGDRHRRMSEAPPKGSAILGSVLATDGTCLDKCMFDSQDVGALACTFIRGTARERDECMVSMCTFGKLQFAGRNNGRVAAKRFKARLDHVPLKAILSRYHSFNRNGGALVPLHGGAVHFRCACVVAMYADLPAARKLLLTGSACNTCYLPWNEMGTPGAFAPLRTWGTMLHKRACFLDRIEAKEDETAADVRQEAKLTGVELEIENALLTPPGDMNVIGPCDDLDNPCSACPPVFLHGMECGTLMKLVAATMNHIVTAAAAVGKTNTTVSRELDACCALVCTVNKRRSNVELGSHPLTPMPHGISAHVMSGKTLDGNKRLTLARLVHGFVASSSLFPPAAKKKHCALYSLVFRCREMMLSPIKRNKLDEAQTLLDDMDAGLIGYMLEYSPSNCNAEKHHQWSHYDFHRKQIGVTAIGGFHKQIFHDKVGTDSKETLASNRGEKTKWGSGASSGDTWHPTTPQENRRADSVVSCE